MRRTRRAVVSLLAFTVALLPLTGVGPAAIQAQAAPSLWGPDVSSWQHPNGAAIDWAKVKAAGASFAFIKATEDSTYTNPYLASDEAGARAAGLIVGAYGFARPALPLSTAATQATYLVHALGGTVDASLPPVLDLEVTGGLSVSELQSWTSRFLRTVQTATGRTPILYTGPYFWSTSMGGSTAFSKYPLWLASYRSTPPGPPAGWSNWTFWQYTSSATVSGVPSTGSVDLSRFAGSLAQLRSLATAPTPAPSSSPTPSPTTSSTPALSPSPSPSPSSTSAPSTTASPTGGSTPPSSSPAPTPASIPQRPCTPRITSTVSGGPWRVHELPDLSSAASGSITNGQSVVIDAQTTNPAGAVTVGARRSAIVDHLRGIGWISDLSQTATPATGFDVLCHAAVTRATGLTRATNSGSVGSSTWGAYQQWHQRAADGSYPALVGNAYQWAASARTAGWTVTSVPLRRSILVLPRGVDGASKRYGSVAYVTAVDAAAAGSATLHVVEMDGTKGIDRWDRRTVPYTRSLRFIVQP